MECRSSSLGCQTFAMCAWNQGKAEFWPVTERRHDFAMEIMETYFANKVAGRFVPNDQNP
jgi:hypothetical protein